mmetsp:Transcript_5369/g.8468  ORF Transcript_5369/g.8468 Transcript_5369/m.8468 type:complete len:307 (-) Transcript_5369:53-973(-)
MTWITLSFRRRIITRTHAHIHTHTHTHTHTVSHRMAIFFWSVGLIFWLLIFISLFQTISVMARRDDKGHRTDIWRFPSSAHPMLFLFIAAPSAAGTSWGAINGWDNVSTVFHSVACFISMFMLLNIRLLLRTKFTVSWWAYTFPLAAISIVTTRYAEGVGADDEVLNLLAFVLSVFSTCVVLLVLGFTIYTGYNEDWTIDERTGKVTRPGLFGIDDVIELCLVKSENSEKVELARCRRNKQQQDSAGSYPFRFSIDDHKHLERQHENIMNHKAVGRSELDGTKETNDTAKFRRGSISASVLHRCPH